MKNPKIHLVLSLTDKLSLFQRDFQFYCSPHLVVLLDWLTTCTTTAFKMSLKIWLFHPIMSLDLVLCHIDQVSWFQRDFQFCSPYPVTNFLIHSPPGTLSPIVPSWGHHALKYIFLSVHRGSQKSAVQTEKWQSRLKKIWREPEKICDVISFRKNE